jgi:glycosyltransferase involved in cell wall biosynthesis
MKVPNASQLYLTFIPLTYHDDEAFWGRDMGLLALGMRENGVDARVVAIGDRKKYADNLPIILGNLADFENPEWWRKLNPYGVVMNTWSATRYDKIRKAVLSVTPRVIEKLDTDGVRSPRIWMRKYLYVTYGSYLDSGNDLKRRFATILAITRTGIIRCFPKLLDKKMAITMSQVPILAAESPIAVARIQRFLRCFISAPPVVTCIPHPVAIEYMRDDSSIRREKRIVCVGRWNAYQKNLPMLKKVLKEFLSVHDDWSADIIGTMPKGFNFRKETPNLSERIRYHGHINRTELAKIYQKSRIFFMPSRYESFNIAAAEALCCGCSIVGSGDISSVSFFTAQNSGTSVCRQTSAHFLDSLNSEVSAWEDGERNPKLISERWISIVGSTSVGKKVLTCIGTIVA